MQFNQQNNHGENKVVVEVKGSLIDQSKQIQEFVVKKDKGQRNANIISVISIIVNILLAIIAIIKK